MPGPDRGVGRNCAGCRRTLSRYNYDSMCQSCQRSGAGSQPSLAADVPASDIPAIPASDAVRPSERKAADYLPLEVLGRADFAAACAARDLGKVFDIAIQRGGAGFSPSHVARRCGMTISQVQEYVKRGRRAQSLDIFDRVSDGLHIPGRMLNIGHRPWETGAQRPEHVADEFPVLVTQAMEASPEAGLEGKTAGRRSALVRARKIAGLTQEMLAEKLGAERTTVIRWERGDTEPLPQIRPVLARALGVSPVELDELLRPDRPSWRERNAVLTALRARQRLSQESLAAAVRKAGWESCDRRTVQRWESGETVAPQYAARAALESVLGVPYEEMGFPRDRDLEIKRDKPHSAGRGGGHSYSAAEEEEVMRRRAFLMDTAILASLARTDPAVASEAVRRELMGSIPGHADYDADEWGEIAWEYGETYQVAAPAEIFESLVIDIRGLQEAFHRCQGEGFQRELSRASALVSAFIAQTVANLGHVQEARRWWRSARYAADRSGDPFSILWVRAREVMHVTSALSPAPIGTVLRLARDAEKFTGGASHDAELELLGGSAQAFALAGLEDEARNGLARLRECYEARSPGGYTGSVLSYGEERLYAIESFVYARLGDIGGLEKALSDSTSIYARDPSDLRHPAANELNRALCLVRRGDLADGFAHARAIVEQLPAPQRAQSIQKRAQAVATAAAPVRSAGPAIGEYQEWLAATFRSEAGLVR